MKYQQPYDYKIEDIAEHVIGDVRKNGDSINFTIYSNHAPIEGDKLLVANKIYECTLSIDDTEDDEADQGLSYSKCELTCISE